jgi:hypothetical protein
MFAPGHKKVGGRTRGSRNKKMALAAEKTYPDALEHLVKVMSSTDPVIIAPSAYQRPKPAPSKAVGAPIDLEPPKTAQEARDAIARIASMIAKAEIDGEHGARIIAGLEAFLSARAAELEAEVEKFRTVEDR